MKKYILVSFSFFLFLQINAQTLVANPQNNQHEGGELRLERSNSNYNVWNIDNYQGFLRFHHDGSSYFSMDPNGNSKLTNNFSVNNLFIASENALPSEGSIGEGDWGNYILTNNTTTRTLRLGVSNDSYTRAEIEIENNNSPLGNIFFKTSNASGGAQVRMKVASNGNVGIGTTSPVEKLDVNGTATIVGDIGIPNSSHWQTGNHTLELQNLDAGDVVLSFHRAGYTNAAIKHTPLGGLIFSGNGAYDANHVFLKFNGNLGIGTTSPDSKLTVKGNIHAEEVKVDLSVPAPDYVFKDDYDLKSLEEVQNYIKENGHLPNVPSAKDMEENGIQLGEMNMKLLEKIEELTLYVLQQQKEIEYLKTKIK